MKLWMILAGGVLVCGAGGCSDLSKPREERIAEVAQLCRERVVEGGHPQAEADRVCGCLVERATTWVDANPDAEYSAEVHERLAKNCVRWG